MSFFVLSFGFFGVLLLDYYPSSVQVQAIYLDAMVARTCRFAPPAACCFCRDYGDEIAPEIDEDSLDGDLLGSYRTTRASQNCCSGLVLP